MKCYLLLFLLALVIAEENSSLEAQFSAFKTQFHRKYASASEEKYRQRVFRENMEIIREHNARQSSYRLGITPFTDLTLEEFQEQFVFNKMLMENRPTSLHSMPNTSASGLGKLPDVVDWRKKNAVSPVKNQKSCGSCWAFSAVGSIEGAYAIKTGKLYSFAPQYLVDCDHGDNGCSGGLMTNAFEFVMMNGVPREEMYPYKAVEGTCQKVELETSILGYYTVPEQSAYELMKAVSKSPVAVAIEASASVFQNYVSGVIDDTSCGTSLDHGVLVVGYSTEQDKGYYIVKNSWGNSWGEYGYVRIAINGDGPGMCGIQMMASYPFIDL